MSLYHILFFLTTNGCDVFTVSSSSAFKASLVERSFSATLADTYKKKRFMKGQKQICVKSRGNGTLKDVADVKTLYCKGISLNSNRGSEVNGVRENFTRISYSSRSR